jgi:hypothetical protein
MQATKAALFYRIASTHQHIEHSLRLRCSVKVITLFTTLSLRPPRFKILASTIRIATPLQNKMSLFPNASQDESNKNAEDARTMIMKEDEIFQEEKFDPRYYSSNDSVKEAPPQRSWFKAVAIYRDFVLSAFTDGYSTVRHGMLVVCFFCGKTWATLSARLRSEYHISNIFIVSSTGILL